MSVVAEEVPPLILHVAGLTDVLFYGFMQHFGLCLRTSLQRLLKHKVAVLALHKFDNHFISGNTDQELVFNLFVGVHYALLHNIRLNLLSRVADDFVEDFCKYLFTFLGRVQLDYMLNSVVSECIPHQLLEVPLNETQYELTFLWE